MEHAWELLSGEVQVIAVEVKVGSARSEGQDGLSSTRPQMKLLLVIFAIAIFSGVTIGGLAALRALRTKLVLRAILFVALCYFVLPGSLRLGMQWDLDPVELGYAWAVGLLVIAGVEWLTYWRRKRILT